MTYHLQIITYPDHPDERARLIIRVDSSGAEATIPEDPDNIDYVAYLAWVAEHGQPPEVTPEWTTK